MYFLVLSVEVVYGKHIVGPHLNFASMWGPTLYTNAISIAPMTAIGLLTGEQARLARVAWSPDAITMLTVSCILGVAISYLGWKARKMATATCYITVGVANKMATVMANALIWDEHASAVGIAFLVVCLAGAAGALSAPPGYGGIDGGRAASSPPSGRAYEAGRAARRAQRASTHPRFSACLLSSPPCAAFEQAPKADESSAASQRTVKRAVIGGGLIVFAAIAIGIVSLASPAPPTVVGGGKGGRGLRGGSGGNGGGGSSGGAHASKKSEHGQLWGVVTTIFEPTPACRTFIGASFQHLHRTKLVVVGDKKTPGSAWTTFANNYPRNSLFYLSPADQVALPYSSVRLTPWNHFGRKNIGFLYAIHHGAQWIFDFDDDNVLNSEAARMLPGIVLRTTRTFPLVETRHHL